MATKDHKFKLHVSPVRSSIGEGLTKSYAFIFSDDIDKWMHSPALKNKKCSQEMKECSQEMKEGFIVRRNKGRAGNL